MKSLKRRIALAIMLISLNQLNLYAQDNSASVRIACTIPEIPGINSPLLIQEKIITSNAQMSILALRAKENGMTPVRPTLIAQEDPKDNATAAGQNDQLRIVQTYYSR